MSFTREIINLILIEEARKDRFILANKNLSNEQQQEIIQLLITKPHIEAEILKIITDWNRFKKYSYEDLLPALTYESKHGASKDKKRKVRSEGINGLDIGKDYIPISKAVYDPSMSVVSLNNQCDHQANGDETLQGIYIPLNYEASKLIGSDKIGGVEGKWCTSYIGMDKYWIDYTSKKKCVLIYVVYDKTKYAILINPDNSYGIFDQIDQPQPNGAENCNLPGLDVKEIIKNSSKVINEVRQHFIDNKPKQHLFNNKGEVLMEINSSEMSDYDFSNISLVGAQFNKVTDINFTNVDFSNNDLTGASFTGCHLDKCNFNSTNLTTVNFTEMSIYESSFIKAKLIDTQLWRTNINNSIFDNAIITSNISASFNTSSFNHTSFSDSHFSDVSFEKCTNMSTSDFSDTTSTTSVDNIVFINTDIVGMGVENFLTVHNIFNLVDYNSFNDVDQLKVTNNLLYLSKELKLNDKNILDLCNYAGKFSYSPQSVGILKNLTENYKKFFNDSNMVSSISSELLNIFISNEYEVIKPFYNLLPNKIIYAIYSYSNNAKWTVPYVFTMDKSLQYIKDISNIDTGEDDFNHISPTFLFSEWVIDYKGKASDNDKFETSVKYDKTDSVVMYLDDIYNELSDEQLIFLLEERKGRDSDSSIRTLARALTEPSNGIYRTNVIKALLEIYSDSRLSKRTLNGIIEIGNPEILKLLEQQNRQGE